MLENDESTEFEALKSLNILLGFAGSLSVMKEEAKCWICPKDTKKPWREPQNLTELRDLTFAQNN